MGQNDKSYAIKLKIGENKTYEIDNIKEFILALKYTNPLKIRDFRLLINIFCQQPFKF
ncbi:hypothetical protein [Clostridium magnum]|uniref:hypothetical protein n=1 Tax=Clostridium magnum TaxID=33954 RepID=UPI000B173147|nr:hypothetical protein [Clostridium magnum]